MPSRGVSNVRFVPLAICRSPSRVTPSSYTLRRPVVGGAVEFGDGRSVGGQDHPRLFVSEKNMKLRGKRVRIIQGASADEADFVAGDRVGAPEGDLASRAAGNGLPHAAWARDGDHFRLAGEELYAVGFDHRVHHAGGAGLALAPTAMTGVNDQWFSDQTISDLPARASAFHVELPLGVIVRGLEYRNN